MRWTAVVIYRTNDGFKEISHTFDEIEEFHDILELGPSWQAIEHIFINYNHGDRLTIEQAELL